MAKEGNQVGEREVTFWCQKRRFAGKFSMHNGANHAQREVQ